MRSEQIHSLGPEKIAELIEAYDELYDTLFKIDPDIWESETLFNKLSSSDSIERMEFMISVYRYVLDIERSERVDSWLDKLKCTGVLLEAKNILSSENIRIDVKKEKRGQ
jgi:hypothetical protein